MSLESAAEAIAVPILIAVAHKLLSGQKVTRDDFDSVNQALAPFVTDEGAERAEVAVELAQDAIYGKRP